MFVENEYKCANCEYHEDTSSSWQIYCNYYGTYYDKTETCSNQKRIKRSEDGTPCYITTIVCDILGLDDECVALQELRELRNKVMQQDPKYKALLFEYDTVGPKIAKCLREDKDRQDIAMRVYNESIFPTATLVASKEYEKAVAKYSSMTTALKKYYGIEADTKGIESYDYTTGGHGKVKKLGEYPTK